MQTDGAPRSKGGGAVLGSSSISEGMGHLTLSIAPLFIP